MIILVDQDGVLADFVTGWDAKFAATYPDAPVLPPEQRTEFEMERSYPAEWRQRVPSIWKRQGFFADLPAMPGAVDGLNALAEAGHEVFICTSPLTEYQHCVPEKFAWVEQHLGRAWTKRIVMTKDKTVVRGDILLDDKPTITGAAVPSWTHLVFDATYNRHLTAAPRFTWADTDALLNHLAAGQVPSAAGWASSRPQLLPA